MVQVLSFEDLMAWIDAEASRKTHHDVELLRHLGGKAKAIYLWPAGATTPCYTRGCIELIMPQLDDFIYWNEWDSFEGWAGICDVLWNTLQCALVDEYAQIQLPRNVT